MVYSIFAKSSIIFVCSYMAMENQQKEISARELLIQEWDWDADEVTFIRELHEDRLHNLLVKIKQASSYKSIFTFTKYSVFIAFAGVYTALYFDLHWLSMLLQLLILIAGFFSLWYFFRLRKVESDADYRKLFLQ